MERVSSYKIGSYPRLAGYGRLPETTKGSFVEAKPKKQYLGMRSLWRKVYGGLGSIVTIRHFQKQPFITCVILSE